MKYIVSQKELQIPEGVEVDMKARVVTVKGKLGTLTKSFKHIPLEISRFKKDSKSNQRIKFKMWMQKKKRAALLGTVKGLIHNMINGVMNGYKSKMVLAYSHFPIAVNIIEDGKAVEIKNFLGFKINKRIDAPQGVIISKKEQEKNVLTLMGINLQDVSQCCARIQQATVIRHKDLRSFLDGIYVQDARLDYND